MCPENALAFFRQATAIWEGNWSAVFTFSALAVYFVHRFMFFFPGYLQHPRLEVVDCKYLPDVLFFHVFVSIVADNVVCAV